VESHHSFVPPSSVRPARQEPRASVVPFSFLGNLEPQKISFSPSTESFTFRSVRTVRPPTDREHPTRQHEKLLWERNLESPKLELYSNFKRLFLSLSMFDHRRPRAGADRRRRPWRSVMSDDARPKIQCRRARGVSVSLLLVLTDPASFTRTVPSCC
jgi:hypothetical protein